MTWSRLAAQAPELADRVWAPFAAERHAVIGTVRADGSPRLSGIEPKLVGGELYLGGMAHAWKSTDLRRDPRFSLHNSTSMAVFEKLGDARIDGTAREITAADERDRYRTYLRETIDFDPGEGFDLFLAEITTALVLTSTGGELVYDRWHHETGVRTLRRG